MKYFIAVLVVACFSAQAQGVALKDGEITKQIEQQQQQQSLQQFNGQQGHHGVDAADLESLRVRKAAYGGGASASIPAPPCPKNYLFSCQPSLKPLPCAAPPPSYQGAYSSVVPVVHAHPEQQLYLDQY